MEGDNITFEYPDFNKIKDELCDKHEVMKVGSILIPVFFSIVVLLSLIGNALVLGILCYYENLKSLTNIFIMNLALSDLLFTVGLPFWAHYYIWGWTLGDKMCRAVCFIFHAGFYSSIVFLVLMTVQRYLAVVYPLSNWESGQGFAQTPVIGWLVSITMALPSPIFSSVMPDPNDPTYCFCEYNSSTAVLTLTYVQNGFFTCTFAIMFFCYVRILQTIFRAQTKKRHRAIKLTICIVVVFFVGWAPYNLVNLLQTLKHWNIEFFRECDVTHHLDYAEHVSKLLAFSHCCLNPVFYIFVGIKFRSYLKEIMLKIFQRPIITSQTKTRTNAQSLGSLY